MTRWRKYAKKKGLEHKSLIHFTEACRTQKLLPNIHVIEDSSITTLPNGLRYGVHVSPVDMEKGSLRIFPFVDLSKLIDNIYYRTLRVFGVIWDIVKSLWSKMRLFFISKIKEGESETKSGSLKIQDHLSRREI